MFYKKLGGIKCLLEVFAGWPGSPLSPLACLPVEQLNRLNLIGSGLSRLSKIPLVCKYYSLLQSQ
jgi:hypothetical protein